MRLAGQAPGDEADADSRVTRVTAMPSESPSGPPGSVKIVEFVLFGQPFTAMTAGVIALSVQRWTGWSACASMNAAARRTAAGGTQPGPTTYRAVMVVFGKVSSMTAAATRVSWFAISGLICVLPEATS